MSRPAGRLRGATRVLALLVSGPIGVVAAAPAVPPKPAAPAAASGFHVPAPARTILKNGLTVLVIERRTIPLV